LLSAYETKHGGLVVFYFAAAANGLQNGVSSMYSANLMRTCHFTGTSTDIGLFLGQWMRGNPKNLWKLRVLVGLAASFWFGAFTSFFATSRFGSMTFLFSAAFFFVIGLSLIVFLMKELDLTFWQATFGQWDWEQTLNKFGSTDAALLSAFDEMDADGDGYLATDELKTYIRQHGIHISTRQFKRMFSTADRDKDGLISKAEWRNLVMETSEQTLKKFGSSNEALLSVFDEMDSDRDGQLKTQELKKFIKKRRIDVSNRQLKRMFSLADRDADGLISREDWKDLIKKTSPEVIMEEEEESDDDDDDGEYTKSSGWHGRIHFLAELDDETPNSIRERGIREIRQGCDLDTPAAIRARSFRLQESIVSERSANLSNRSGIGSSTRSHTTFGSQGSSSNLFDSDGRLGKGGADQ